MQAEDEATGWDAIEAAVANVVPDQTPIHWGTNNLPNRDGLYAISAYHAGPHWILVTFGLTELFGKTDEADPGVSGWGFELTLRVPATDSSPPAWTLTLLQQLGEYVYDSGKPLGVGHRMDPGGPITGASDTRLTALAFTADPELPTVESPNGSFTFLAVVGITADELARMKQTSTAEVLGELAESSPLLVTDVSR